jgi:hypothetical protein
MLSAVRHVIDFSGHYRMFQQNYWNQGFDDKDNKSSDSFFTNRLQMDFGFHATDEVSVYWRLRAPVKQRWGDSSGTTLKSQYYYGEVKQDWGTVAVGHLNDSRNMFGLASLGWVPDGPDVNATGFDPFDINDATDGIHYLNRWDNGFQLAAGYLRLGVVPNLRDGDDQTADLFVIEPAFLWDGGGASLGLHYLRDNASDYDAAKVLPQDGALKLFRINPAIAHSFGDFSVHFEGMAAWGSQEKYIEPAMKDVDVEGYAFYMDVDYNYGPGNVNLAGWWAAGPGNNDGDGKIKGQVGFEDFAPLIVAYNHSYGWNRGSYTRGNKAVDAVQVANQLSGPLTADDTANHWGIDLNGTHAFTDDLTLTYALAYLALNKTAEGSKKSIGVEADLGLQIQLLDNLHFGTTFGYLFAGDALKGYEGGTRGDFARTDAEDAYTWLNTLTFSF